MTSNTFPNYQPCYFINQNPSLFGGKQQDYIEKSQTIIRAAAEKIKVCRQEKGDIKKLFFELIAELSDKRAAIAAEHQTMEAEDFGKRRDQHYPGSVPALLLDGVYQEYGTKILNFFAPYLMKMESNGQFEELTKEDKWNGRTTKLQFTVLNNKDLSDKGYTKEADLYLPPYIDKTKLAKEKVWASKEAEEYFEKFLQFKTDSPEEYKRRKIRIILVELARKCPSPANLKLSPYQVQEKFSKEEANSILNNMKSLHVHIILRTEIEGKLYALTEYFTWMYECKEWIEKKDPDFHPVAEMQRKSKVYLLHQDAFLIQKTLEEIANIFKAAVLWDPTTQKIKDLKDSLGLFCYLSAHNMRDVRGSASENEWLEQAIVLSHNLTMTSDSKKVVDLEAFANPFLSDFIKVYDQMTDIK